MPVVVQKTFNSSGIETVHSSKSSYQIKLSCLSVLLVLTVFFLSQVDPQSHQALHFRFHSCQSLPDFLITSCSSWFQLFPGTFPIVSWYFASYSSSPQVIQRASEASEADSQSCSIEISDIYIYICRYVCVRQKISPALLIT